MIKLENVTKKFGSFTAVDNLSLAVAPGEFFGFLGPNGAGKTTTIKMITGLFTPSSGTISIYGHDTVQDPIEAKKVTAYVPDQPFLYDKLTGREFLYFIAGLYDIRRNGIDSAIDRLIEHFEIEEWIDRRTEEYSQGMRQRTTIASAILHDPKVIIIDEPMIGLDPKSAKIVRDTLKTLAAKGVTIFMSTHSLNVAEELCDRIGIINHGKLAFLGDRHALAEVKKKVHGDLEKAFLEITKE